MKKSKFKETEIGMIPEDWNIQRVRDMDNTKEIVRTGPFGSLLHASDYSQDGVPLLLVRNISDGKVIDDDFPKVRTEKAQQLKSFWLNEGDIVFTRVGAVGRTLYVTKKEDGWMFSGQTLRIRIRNPKINNRFIELFFRSPTAKALSENTSLGTTRPSINTSILSNRVVPIPPVPEQNEIVNIISSIEDKIDLNRQMNSTLEAIAQSLFKRWFVDFEFPNEKGKPYKSSGGEMVDSELGMIPKGWIVKPLDEIADFLNGLALQKYPPEGEDYIPIIKIRELKHGITDSSDKASTGIDKQYIVHDGDVLFSWSGSLEVCLWCGGEGALNQHLFKVTSSEYPKWLFYKWINNYLPDFQHIAESKVTTMGHIQRRHLSEKMVCIPTPDVMKKMNQVMIPLFEKLIVSSVESRKLTITRDLLLPKLMSGQIRVPNGGVV